MLVDSSPRDVVIVFSIMLAALILLIACTDSPAAPAPGFEPTFTTHAEGRTILADAYASKFPPSESRRRYIFAWGDGTSDVHGDAVMTHDYARPGTYTIELAIGFVDTPAPLATTTRTVTIR